MYKNILFFELKYRSKKISTYIYFALFLFLGYFAIYRASHGSGILYALTQAGGGNINANAPYAIHYFITFLSNYGILIASAFFGNAAYRDYKENTFELYFSYPIKKINYFAGRFSGAFLSSLFVFSGAGIGGCLATVSPILTNPEKIGHINIFSNIQPYLVSVIPNLLLAGALFFALVLLTRKFTSTYLAIIVLVVAYLIGASLNASLNSKLIPSLIDPFGMLAIRGFYEYWAPAQKNILLIPFSGILFFNRLIWTSLGIIVLIFTYRKFDFSYITGSKGRRSKELDVNTQKSPGLLGKPLFSSKPTLIFSLKNHINEMLQTALLEFSGIVKNIYFFIIILMGVGLIFLIGFKNVGIVNGIQTYPVTSQVLESIGNIFYLFNLVVILFCSGELVWRERNKKVQDIYDAIPIPEWVPFLGKLGALFLIQIMMMFIIMICGLIIQVFLGYYHFELTLYFKELFGIRLIYYLLVSIFAVFSQVIINKRFLGNILTILFVDDFMSVIGLKHHLWTFAETDFYSYSDMNGFGPYVQQLFFYNSFWIFYSLILITLSLLFWVRGKDYRLKDRIHTIQLRITKPKLITGGTGLFFSLLFGSVIIYNTTVLNKFETNETFEKYSVTYEKKYKSYENILQPTITDIKLDIDLYPGQRNYISKGRITLLNKTSNDIQKIFVQVPEKVIVNELSFGIPHQLAFSDSDYGIYIYQLNTPMEPHKQLNLHFYIEFAEKGFKDRNINTTLIENGTSLRHYHLLPRIGYDPNYELSNNDKRKKFGLNPKERIPSIHDKQAKMYYGYGRDANWINYEATISTSKDQIALTAGDFVKEWLEGERRYFHYKTKEKINKYFPVVSARYKVKKDRWQDIDIEVYYNKRHEYNIDRMIYALKKSFEYYTQNFSPYQFKIIRIVEFPRYEQYAESLPTIIPYSEGLGFIMKLDDEDMDFIFHVTAHELGHQWWAQQVRGAYVQGTTLLSEVMAQYSTFMAFKKEFAQDKVDKLVKFYLDRYLRGRARESEGEVPLLFVENQPYIHYGKGLVVMNTLQDYLGEDTLNAAIRKYIKKVAFQEPPYTTSLEFLEYIKEATPDSLNYIITDMFETITLYENKAVNATYKQLENGKYSVSLKFKAEKKRADEVGNETSIPVNDLITFGVFGLQGEELYLNKHWVKNNEGELNFTVDGIPEKAGIDPYYYLIDKKIEDNIVKATEE